MADQNPYLSLVQTDESNPYAAAATEAPDVTPARLSMMQVAGRNPDTEARLQALAKQYSVPTEAIRLEQPDFERRATVDSIDYATLARDYPATAGMVADPQKAAISYDDTPNLSAIEKGVRFLANSARALGAAVPGANEAFWGVAQAGADTLAMLASPLAGTVLPENPFERVAAGVAGLRQRQAAVRQSMMPRAEGVLESGWYSGMQSLGQMGLAVPAMLTGNPTAALGMLSGTAGGQAYGEARDKGVAPQVAIPFAVSQAAIEYATEHLPVARFLTDFKAGTPFLSMLARNMAAEIPGEQVATVLQDLNEWAVLNPDKPFSSYLQERPSAAAQTLIATLVASGGAITTTKAVQSAADRVQGRTAQAQQAVQAADALAEVDQLAAASKLRERAPESFREFVAQAAQDGAVQDVFIDANQLQELAQSGVDLSPLVAASPSVAEQIAEAVQTGGSVRIPVEDYATYVAGTETGTALLPHLKTDPAGMSRAEAEQFMQGRADELKREVEQTLTERDGDAAFQTSRAAVEQQILDQLNQTKRFTDSVNQAYATLMGSFYAVQAARAGVTPEALFQQYPVQIRAENVASPGRIFSDAIAAAPAAPTQQPTATEDGPPATASAASAASAAPSAQLAAVAPPATLEQGAGGQRGSFNPATNTITLLKNADLSTFLHESGHFYLEVQFDLAAKMLQTPADERTHGQQAVLDDAATLLKWFGVRDLDEWSNLDFEEKRSYHERFARGFEAYLFEGKAPNIQLQGVFQRFRAWLLNVYQNLKALNVELDDSVRGVFDRMLASADEIKLLEQGRSMLPLFASAAQAGMTEDEFAAYQNLGVDASNTAIQELQARGLRDMRWLHNARGREIKRLQKEAAARRAEIQMDVRREVMSQPIYRAWQFLTGKPQTTPTEQTTAEDTPDDQHYGKFDLEAVRAIGVPKEVSERVKTLRMTGKDGLHPDVVADLFDFSSGDELVRSLAAVLPPRDEINALTDQRMLERYGEMADQEAIERAADEAVHNDARARMIATEANALAKALGEREDTGRADRKGRPITRAILPQAARQFAESMIARLKVREIRPSQYSAAETRAARAAQEASRAGDLQRAVAEKRNQLVNAYATRAAFNAQEQVESGLRYLRKFANEGTRKGLDADYTDQIDTLLERFDLRQRTLKDIDRSTSLAEWLTAQREQGLEPDVPQALQNEAFRKSFKDMTVDEFRGLVDTVKQIEHLGRLKHRLLTAQDQRSYEAIRDEIAASIEQHAGSRVANTRTPTTNLGRAAAGLKRFWSAHIKAATWARVLDGGRDGGPVWEYFVHSANIRGDSETTMRAQATAALSAILSPVFKLGRMGGKGVYFPSIDRSLNREARLAIALNTGNASNLQRLLGGEGWTLAQIQPVLQSLTAQEWRAVQAIWDHFESYRPRIAEKEKRVYGKEPEWVEPQPFQMQTADGQVVDLRGGYYPIKYDPAASQRAEEHADAETAKRQLQGAYTSATTRRSFTKARADEVTGRPLLYSLAGLYSGVNDVIHDLAWHEWLIDANRLLRSKSIDGAIRRHYGPEAKQQLKTWAAAIAEGERGTDAAVDQVLSRLRQGVSVSGLGFNVMSAAMQPLGITQSIVRVGAPWIARGVASYIASPIASTREVNAKSDFMANRARTRFRELNELRNQVQDQSAAKERVGRYAYFLMMRAQQMVDMPTWLGAYEKAIADGNAEDRAIGLADQAVIDAQGGGQTKDLSAIERGGPAQKLFTVFYSFMNTALNAGVAQTMTADTPAKRARLAVDYALLYVAPAVLGFFLKEALTPGGGDDDWEKLARKLLAAQIDYLMGLMVVVREFGEAAKTVTGANDRGRDYTGPAGLRMVADSITFAKQAHQGEFDDAFRKSAVNVVGDLLGLPSAQVNRTITGAQALADDKTSNPAALVFGYQKN